MPNASVRGRKIALSMLTNVGDTMTVRNKKLVTANWWIKWYHEMPVGAIKEISEAQRAYRFEAEQVGEDVQIRRIK